MIFIRGILSNLFFSFSKVSNLPSRSRPIISNYEIGVSKNSGYPKMDGENDGKPY